MDEQRIPKNNGNEDEWKKIHRQTTHTMDRPN
jgi:hypothetical protein